LSSLDILDINLLLDKYLTKIFSHSLTYLFTLLIIAFVDQKLFNTMRWYLPILALIFRVIGILFRKESPTPIPSSVSPMFSYSSFQVSGLTLRSLIHFELIFVQSERCGSILVFYMWIYSFPSTTYKEAVFSPMYPFWCLCQE
jgi:hypothetical protein